MISVNMGSVTILTNHFICSIKNFSIDFQKVQFWEVSIYLKKEHGEIFLSTNVPMSKGLGFLYVLLK